MAVPGGGPPQLAAVPLSSSSQEEVYATLLLSDTYVPGALVLAHALRDNGATKKLVCLVTLDTVSAEVITLLKVCVFDYILPVSRIKNSVKTNLELMNRPDLHSAFTKVNLWRQVQFKRIIYLDADVLPYRAPEELFALPHPFSAAPDIGWPDIFNTGVMVLEPNMADYYSMMAMAERNISFDGADQGLINQHFGQNYNRISFTYNVTPSAHYQYLPAYNHFRSGISMVHFIGPDKPWFQGRSSASSDSDSPFQHMTARWWAAYDAHYGPKAQPTATAADTATAQAKSVSQPKQQVPKLLQYHTKGEYQPEAAPLKLLPAQVAHGDNAAPAAGQDHEHQEHVHAEASASSAPQQPSGDLTGTPHHAEEVVTTQDSEHAQQAQPVEHKQEEKRQPEPEPEPEPEPFQPTMSQWNAQWHPPPQDSVPEAINFPSTTYEMSDDPTPFVPPARYPSPPRNMWYELPKEPPAPPSSKLKPIFPWEADRAEPSRTFVEDYPEQERETVAKEEAGKATERLPDPVEDMEKKLGPVEPIKTPPLSTPIDIWSSFPRTNAWDDVPAITEYVGAMDRHYRTERAKALGQISLPSATDAVDKEAWARRGSKVTDFPSEAERPSLPVTPAPVRRPKFGPSVPEDKDEDPSLPAAEGVPGQVDWDPSEQLQKLAHQRTDVLLEKLSSSHHDSDDLPPRPVPFGSEDLVSPSYIAHSPNIACPQPRRGVDGKRIFSDLFVHTDFPNEAPNQPVPMDEESQQVEEGSSRETATK